MLLYDGGGQILDSTGLRLRGLDPSLRFDVSASLLDQTTEVRFIGYTAAELAPEILPDAKTLAETELTSATDTGAALPVPLWKKHAFLGDSDSAVPEDDPQSPPLTASWLPECELAYGPATLRLKCPHGIECSAPYPGLELVNRDAENGCFLREFDTKLVEQSRAAFASCERVSASLRLLFPPNGSSTDTATIPVTLIGGTGVASLEIANVEAVTADCGDSWRAEVELGAGDNTLVFEPIGPDAGSVPVSRVHLEQMLTSPQSIIVDSAHHAMIADHTGLRGVDLVQGAVTNVFDQPSYASDRLRPMGVAPDPSGNGILFVDPSRGVFRIRPPFAKAEPVLTMLEATSNPTDIAIDPHRPHIVLMIFAGTAELSSKLYELDVETNDQRTITGGAPCSPCVPLVGLAVDPSAIAESALVLDQRGILNEIDIASGARTSTIDCSRDLGPIDARDLALDAPSSRAYFADRASNGIVAVDLASGTCAIASSAARQVGAGPELVGPFGVALGDAPGTLIVSDEQRNALFEITVPGGDRRVITELTAGDGERFERPIGLAIDPEHLRLFVADAGREAIIEVEIESGDRRTIRMGPELSELGQLDYDGSACLIVAANGSVLAVDRENGALTHLRDGLREPWGVAARGNGEEVFVTDRGAIDQPEAPRIIAIDPSTGMARVVAAAGDGKGIELVRPRALALSDALDRLYVVDEDSGREGVVEIDLGDEHRRPLLPDMEENCSKSTFAFRAIAVDKSGDYGAFLARDGTGVARALSYDVGPCRLPREIDRHALLGPAYDGLAAMVTVKGRVIYVVSEVLRSVVAVEPISGGSVLISR